MSCHRFTHLQFLKWQSAVPRGYKSVPCGYKSVPRGYKSVPRGYKLVPCGYKYTRSGIELPGQLKKEEDVVENMNKGLTDAKELEPGEKLLVQKHFPIPPLK